MQNDKTYSLEKDKLMHKLLQHIYREDNITLYAYTLSWYLNDKTQGYIQITYLHIYIHKMSIMFNLSIFTSLCKFNTYASQKNTPILTIFQLY